MEKVEFPRMIKVAPVSQERSWEISIDQKERDLIKRIKTIIKDNEDFTKDEYECPSCLKIMKTHQALVAYC